MSVKIRLQRGRSISRSKNCSISKIIWYTTSSSGSWA